MKKIKDLTGMKFGQWTVISNGERKYNIHHYLCRCQCGKQQNIRITRLKKVKRCKQCYIKEMVLSKTGKCISNRDLTGQKIGSLTILKRLYVFNETIKKNQAYYEVKCDCNNERLKMIRCQDIQNGRTKTCNNCVFSQAEKALNKLHDYLTPVKLYTKDKRLWFQCNCLCGNKHNVYVNHLLNGYTGSCGCMAKSKGEKKITQILKANNIQFISQKIFSKCINPQTNSKLKFDFYIPNKNTIIEYHGTQHFNPKTGWGKTLQDKLERYKKLKQRDQIKKKWCISNGVRFIMIPFTQKDNLQKILRKCRIL